jgi:hypothetical protein
MTPERWRRITEIFHAARQQPERAAFLEKACGEDAALLQEVEVLLREDAGAVGLLETGALKRIGEALQARMPEDDLAGADTAQSAAWPASAGTTAGAVPTVFPITPDHAHESSSSLSRLGPLDDARFAPGRMFASRYRIVSRLGRGGMGEVYRAEDLKLGQPVAIKLLPFRVARGDELLRRFIAEVRLARGVTHPNVCRVYDIGQAEGGITCPWNTWTVRRLRRSCSASAVCLVRRHSTSPDSSALVWQPHTNEASCTATSSR